jgi:molecular chaperone GrpE
MSPGIKTDMAEEEIKNDKETAENSEQETKQENKEKTPEEKLAEMNDKYVRLYAEFDNFRKRSMKERAEYLKYAGEEVYKALLPVVDDFERGIKANENIDDAKTIKEGIQLVYNKLSHILKQAGIEIMDSKGKEFDAETMEAITNIPAPTPDLKGKVVDEVEKGYSMNGKVIRYAKVVVGS